jgi:hypothetical protein
VLDWVGKHAKTGSVILTSILTLGFPRVKFEESPLFSKVGAGEGNRTLVSGVVARSGRKWWILL